MGEKEDSKFCHFHGNETAIVAGCLVGRIGNCDFVSCFWKFENAFKVKTTSHAMANCQLI